MCCQIDVKNVHNVQAILQRNRQQMFSLLCRAHSQVLKPPPEWTSLLVLMPNGSINSLQMTTLHTQVWTTFNSVYKYIQLVILDWLDVDVMLNMSLFTGKLTEMLRDVMLHSCWC